MSLAFSKTRTIFGMRTQSVTVEVHLSNGLPNFTIVGLAETAVKESKDRVRSAIINSQFEFPCRRITVNLAPANLPKSGSGFDLPIAIGILIASGQIPNKELSDYEFIAELALCGNLRGISAIVPIVIGASLEKQNLIIAKANANEAKISGSKNIFIAANLREVCSFLCQESSLESLPSRPESGREEYNIDWSDIRGQEHAKQALVVAASGGHSLLLNGPPGSGKTMLAKRFITLLPNLNENQALECATINSLHGRGPNFENWLAPPFRSPHHTASPVALVGGGNPPKPGEISLAHNGVLFLDELPEFTKQVLETLREPIESGFICISRAAVQIEYPSRFQLIAAMNPCPCGHWGNLEANCSCSTERVSRYLRKLSAPLLDRIDMYIHVQNVAEDLLINPIKNSPKESLKLRQKIGELHALQENRQGCLNALLNSADCEKICDLGQEERDFLILALQKLKLSARAYHRLLKVARTIADIRTEPRVNITALQQALAFKQTLELPK